MKKGYISFILIVMTGVSMAQSFTSYMTGNPADVSPQPEFGICLMGGGSENDEAMKWFLQRANGGDVVVIRTSGTNGYNNYMYSQLGVSVNSVETIVFHNASAANDPYVIQQLQNAEAIWIAGGNQATYVNYWKGTAVEQAINDLLLVKGGAVGGTSAGMAILGGSYYSALNNSATSAQALNNPYHNNVTLGHGDFLHAPFLQNVITDTHFDNPDRRGRMTAFMARMHTDEAIYPLGIACDEYAGVCIGPDGIARCYGEAPQYNDYVYFIRPNCPEPIGPETCQPGTPLTWNRNGQALKAYRINATMTGTLTFDLNDWLTGNGGEWLNWSAVNGNFTQTTGATAPTCPVSTPLPGCTDPDACNYQPAANQDDGSCTYPGCTDPNSCFYDPAAGCDDGSCGILPCADCPGDFNQDLTVNFADLSILLSEFGCAVNCQTDLNEDSQVNFADLTIFLSVFGATCF